MGCVHIVIDTAAMQVVQCVIHLDDARVLEAAGKNSCVVVHAHVDDVMDDEEFCANHPGGYEELNGDTGLYATLGPDQTGKGILVCAMDGRVWSLCLLEQDGKLPMETLNFVLRDIKEAYDASHPAK